MTQELVTPTSGFENGPPPPADFRPFSPESAPSVESLQGVLEGKAPEPPKITPVDTDVRLCAGLILEDGRVVRDAKVRELNGLAEEKLSRVDRVKNAASFLTELLLVGVESIGGEAPTREVVQRLLLGDRDQLMLGIRKATYGPEMEFTLNCDNCGTESRVLINLDDDIAVEELEDPLKRTFEVQLRRGTGVIKLLTGADQEAFAENFSRRTQAEIDTVMIARSLVEINGMPVYGGMSESTALSLPAGDRATIADFIAAHQPGPKTNEIKVNCGTCSQEYPILIGLGNLFRF